jgi:hypothetical protein
VKKAFSSLKEIVGHDIACEPQWQLLWTELQDSFTEIDQFVPTIANAVASWAEALTQICDEGTNEEWTEEMLERVKQAGSMIRLELLVSTANGRLHGIRVVNDKKAVTGTVPSTKWSDRARGFEICFPKTKDKSMSTAQIMGQVMARFHKDLLGAFKPTQQEPVPDASEQWVDAGDGASDIDAASVMTPITTEQSFPVRSIIVQKLPQLNMLDRPEDLCARAPYHLILRESDRCIAVTSSHQPSLELLAGYLKKWTKANPRFVHRVSFHIYP